MKMPNGDDRAPRIVEGVIVTGDVFVSDMASREELRTAFRATAVEMEGGAVVQTCRQFRVSCLIVRGITDRADTNAPTNYEQFLVTASQNAATLVTTIIGGLEDGTR
jgi:adenosylhomocysteine nucleosidase